MLEVLLLAAGASRRMGKSKALLDWKGMPLIRYQIDRLIAFGLPISVVLGANAERIKHEISDSNVAVFVNPEWQSGMGNSIAFGLEALLEQKPETEAVLLLLIDQPLLELADLRNLISKFEQQNDKIWVSKSKEGWSGPPVIFPKDLFAELLTLAGDDGAKPVVRKNPDRVIRVPFQSNMADMDTPEAYEALLKQS